MSHPEPSRTIPEDDLADLLGIQRTVLREQRNLRMKSPSHWALKKNRPTYTAEGVRELCAALALPLPSGWEIPEPVNPWTTAAHCAPEKKDGGPALETFAALAAAVAPTVPAPALSSEALAAKLPWGARVVFCVRRAARNRHVVFAQERDEAGKYFGTEFCVRVKDAELVAIGDEMHVRTQNSMAWLYGQQPKSRRAVRRFTPSPSAR